MHSLHEQCILNIQSKWRGNESCILSQLSSYRRLGRGKSRRIVFHRRRHSCAACAWEGGGEGRLSVCLLSLGDTRCCWCCWCWFCFLSFRDLFEDGRNTLGKGSWRCRQCWGEHPCYGDHHVVSLKMRKMMIKTIMWDDDDQYVRVVTLILIVFTSRVGLLGLGLTFLCVIIYGVSK